MRLRASRRLRSGVSLLYLICAVTVGTASLGWTLKLPLLLAQAVLLHRDLKRIGAVARQRLHFGERLAVVGDDADWSVVQVRQIGAALWLGWRDGSGSRRDLMLLADNFERVEDWHLCRLWARQRAAAAVP
ncbi:MAG: hypothetical protein KDH15_11170 [Rhodocyclaceae bacterium]|nr:hypothetical protein [Rhodocyclaceae bacterium]